MHVCVCKLFFNGFIFVSDLRNVQSKEELFKKFEADVLMAQKLTGGQVDLFAKIEEDLNKRRIDYSNLGFGPPKPKKKKEERVKIGSDISEAVRYKKDVVISDSNQKRLPLQHKVVIMEQPHVNNMKEDLHKACNSYTCYTCGFSCNRLGVIVWHNKGHLKTVINYDTGIRIPGRKKRKPRIPKPKVKKDDKQQQEPSKPTVNGVDHSKLNGHHAMNGEESEEAKQLLMDWDDEDTDLEQTANDDDTEQSTSNTNNDGSDECENDGDDDDVIGEYGQSSNDRTERQPMRGADDLNSAFDALLADTPTSNNVSSNNANNYINNQSDSDNSDWEKYYDKSSGDEDDMEDDEPKESDIKSLCEVEAAVAEQREGDSSEDMVTSTVITTNGTLNGDERNISPGDPGGSSSSAYNKEEYKEGGPPMSDSMIKRNAAATAADDEDDDVNRNPQQHHYRGNTSPDDDISYNSPEPSNQKDDPSSSAGEEKEEDSRHSSSNTNKEATAASTTTGCSSSTSSCSSSPSTPAYMLVAVDAHGNNVPMPALTDRNSHSSQNLVAVEASMEDGTSRTLYIDPAYLEPNVDLSNLMLHIDNSGQETVIIPSTASHDTVVHEVAPQQASAGHMQDTEPHVTQCASGRQDQHQDSPRYYTEEGEEVMGEVSSSSGGGGLPMHLQRQLQAQQQQEPEAESSSFVVESSSSQYFSEYSKMPRDENL